MDLVLKE